ncbi:MAG TPA: hypothetical protein VF941_11940 [Clostridia bacterium]
MENGIGEFKLMKKKIELALLKAIKFLLSTKGKNEIKRRVKFSLKEWMVNGDTSQNLINQLNNVEAINQKEGE